MFDHIRRLFAATNEAKVRSYLPGRFSFNVRGGRCEACAGDGTIKIDMQFLPDIYVPCEVCKGKRYNRETLEVHYKGHTVADVLDMSVEEALGLFASIPPIARHLVTLNDVGLGYIKLGQPASTLSGARPSGSSWPASWPSRPPAAPCTCSTSRPPASTSRTSASSWGCCTGWSTRATR